MAHEQVASWQLPVAVVTPSDVIRVRRELLELDDYLRQQGLRTPGTPMARLPKLSRLLDTLAELNNINLLDAKARQEVIDFLSQISDRAPLVHMSFTTEPAPAFLQKIVEWFRGSIHPYVLVRVGLQPALAAGCTLRTTNKFFDMSLKQRLEKSRPILVQDLAGRPSPEEAPEPQPVEATA